MENFKQVEEERIALKILSTYPRSVVCVCAWCVYMRVHSSIRAHIDAREWLSSSIVLSFKF